MSGAASGSFADGELSDDAPVDLAVEPAKTPSSGDPGVLVRWSFSPGTDAPGCARSLVTEALADASEPIDLIVLMVSELVTNAVLHTQQRAEFRLIDLGPLGLRAEVEDRDSHPPAPSAHPGASGGYGLRIIDSFARSWGTTLLGPQPGKVVWFEVDRT